jgi:protein KRI1
VGVTHVEEQQRLRDETIAAFHAVDGDEEEDWLVPREKTMDEVAREEEEYRLFLEKEVGDLRDLVDVGGHTAVAEQPQEEGSATKKKKKKEKKDKQSSGEGSSKATAGSSKQEQDQDFLVKCVISFLHGEAGLSFE